MIPKQHEIARHGNVVWSSDAPDAGPYRIGTPWFVWTTFGERVSEAAVPGSERQLETFYASRAVFHALRDLTDGTLADSSEALVRTGTLAARKILRAIRRGTAKVDTDDLEAEVREKVAAVLEAARR